MINVLNINGNFKGIGTGNGLFQLKAPGNGGSAVEQCIRGCGMRCKYCYM